MSDRLDLRAAVHDAVVKVTEWGVQTERICPPRGPSVLLRMGPKTRVTAPVATPAATAGCDAGCDACGLALPGIGPRVRKKLMRKTLVYSVPAVQSVRPAGWPGRARLHGMRSRMAIVPDCKLTSPEESTPAESLAAAGRPATVHWLNVSDAAGHDAADIVDRRCRPWPSYAERNRLRSPVKIHWIDGHRVEHVESLGTMSETLDIQPPAPITTQPRSGGYGDFTLNIAAHFDPALAIMLLKCRKETAMPTNRNSP